MRAAAWVGMTLLASTVAGYALWAIAVPSARPDLLADLFDRTPVWIFLHLAGGSVALVAGAFQVNQRTRSRYPALHRRLGRAYIIGVVSAGGAGIPLAAGSSGGITTEIGFSWLAVGWLGTTILALGAIRRRDIAEHRRWMYRSYALTLAAVTLRVYMPLLIMAGLEPEAAYRMVSWLCWVPNLVLAEVWFVQRPSSP